SRWWASGATFAFNPDGKEFSVKLPWGRTIKLDLATGKVTPPPGAGLGGRKDSNVTLEIHPVPGGPTPIEILSGKPLNALLNELKDFQAKGASGPKVELKKDVLEQINVTRGEGDVGMLRSARKIPWPQFFEEDGFKAQRQQAEALLRRALEQARKGKVEA